MKKQILIILLLLLNSLIVFLPVDIVKGDPNPSGGNIGGDTVYWENSYANLSVYPHTSTNIVRQKQWANLTWLATDNTIDVAFRFNDSLSYGKIWKWNGASWNEVTMQHTTYNGKHYYYYAGFNVMQNTTYRFKWEYDTIANTSGKWWLFAKLNEHTIQQSLANNWYVALDPWWHSNWQKQVSIKIDNDYINSDLTDFPLLVNISADISQYCDEGDSVRFVNSGNDTEYAFEFNEGFDGSTYNLIWVNITSISSTANTFFNMYFNNSNVASGENAAGVWEGNYSSVYHMEDSGSTIADSTSNSYDAISYNTVSQHINGSVGNCQDFSTDGYVETDTAFFDLTDTTFSWEWWTYADNNVANYGQLVTNEYHVHDDNVNDYRGYIASGSTLLYFDMDNGTGGWSTVSKDSTYLNEWHHVVFQRNGNNIYLFIDGMQRDTDTTTYTTTGTSKISMGRYYNAGWQAFLDGKLDEVRLSASVRSDAWINASYYTMTETAGMITVSAITNQSIPIYTNSTTDITNTTAELHGYIKEPPSGVVLNGDYTSGFWYGVNSTLVEGTYDTNATAGSYSENTSFTYNISNLSHVTTYYVRAWISNATYWIAAGNSVSFTTNGELPVFSSVSPSNQSTSDIGDDLSISIVDPDGNLINWTIETSPDIGDSSGNDETNGTKTCSITPIHNTEYEWYVNSTDGYGWTNRSYTFTATITYVDAPTDGVSVYDETNNRLNLSWTAADRADNYVVVQRNDTYATSATQSGNWIRQNDSAIFWNESWTETSGGYFTIFSYNSTASIYSYSTGTPLGLDMPWGALALSCFNESNPSDAINFDIEISNSDFTTTYAATNLSNIHYIDMEDIPYGDDTIFLVSNSSFETRSYTYDISQNAFYNLVFYLPLALPPDPDENITYAEDYVIHVVGPATEYGVDPPIEGAEVIIRKYISTTESYETVGVYVTSADGTFTVPLLPNNLYSFNISATGYYDEIESWMPVEIVFEGDRHHIFRLAPLDIGDDPIEDYDTFWDTITFTGVMNDIDGVNGTITITYSDSNLSTTNTQIYIYEIYNGITTLIATISNTSENSFTYTTGVINTTRLHIALLYFNNTANFDVSSPISMPIHNINPWTERTRFDIEDRATNIFGPFSLGYANFIAAFLAVIALVMFGPHNTGIGIITAGFTLGITSWLFTTMFTGGFNAGLTIITPLIVIIGGMYVLIKDPGGHL